MAALQRVYAGELQRILSIEKLYSELRKRLPAVLNQADYSIGFKCEMSRVLRVLALMGFDEERGASHVLSNQQHRIRIVEPRAGWNPVLLVLN